MNDNDLDHIAAVSFCIFTLTLILSMAFVHAAAYAASSEEFTEGLIRAVDASGYGVEFDGSQCTRVAGCVRFLFDEDALSDGEMYVYDDGIGTMNPVENGEFDIIGSGCSKVRFYRRSRDGSLTGLGGRFSVECEDGIYEKPEAMLEEEGEGFLLTVMPGERSRVYAKVSGAKNGYVEEIDDRTEFSLKEDGIYGISVYSEDGMGHRTYAGLPDRIVVDNTPPVIKDPGEIPHISKVAVLIPLEAYDEVSGVEGIYVSTGDMTYRTDALRIEPPFRGRVDCWAVDNSGNATEKICLGEDIIADDEPPVISSSSCSIDEKTLSLVVSAEDAVCKQAAVTISSDGKVLYKGNGKKERVNIDISGMSYGRKDFVIRAEDAAGNTSQSSFSVMKQDGKAPELSLAGVSDKGIYGRDVDLEILAQDDSKEECTVSCTIARYDLKGEYIGEDKRSERILHFVDSGVYVVTAEASDSAGNKAIRSAAFAIDKDAPVIRGLLGLNGKTLKSFMMDKGGSLAYDDSMVEVKILLNGMDYDGSKVTKCGRYRLSVLAMDEYGNNSAGEADFEIKR